MTEFKNTNYWFNVKNGKLTLKFEGRTYTVDVEHTEKHAFVMVHDERTVLWFNETISGKAFRTYVNDVIYLVSKEALDKVKNETLKGTTLATVE